MAVKRENVWRKRLEDEVMAAWQGSEIIKMHIGAMDGAGLPDLYIASPGRGQVWLELKYVPPDKLMDWKQQPTALQKERIRRLYYAGARVGVVVFFEEFWCSLHGAALAGPSGAMRLEQKWDSADSRWWRNHVWGGGAETLTRLIWW